MRRALVVAAIALGACKQPATAPPSPPAPSTNPDGATASNERPRVLVVDIEGSLAEQAQPFDFKGGPTLLRVLRKLDDAARDERTKAVVVRLGDVSLSTAKASELHDALAALVAANKKVVCHIEGGEDAMLLVTTACQRVVAAPASELFFVGAHVDTFFFKPLLDKLGLAADFEHIGRWKGAAEPLTRDAPTPELASTLRSIADSADAQVAAALAASTRAASPAAAATLLDKGPYTAQSAVEAHLVDAVGYGDDVVSDTVKDVGQNAEVVEAFPRKKPKEDLSGLLEALGAKKHAHPTRPHVAIVPVVGTIVSTAESAWSQSAAADELVRTLDEVAGNDAVKAVILRVDSPGGSALASDLIWRAAMRVRARKPLFASMGSYAASGGYYISSSAQEIFAEPTTITGSIGVVGGKIVLAGLLDKLAIKPYRYGGRARSDLMSPLSPWTPDERAAIVATMQSTYDLFVARVAEGRKLPPDDVRAVAEGRVWTGDEAKARKLVDDIGGIEATLAKARQAGGLAPDAPYDLYPGPKSPFELFANAGGDDTSTELRAELSLLPAPLRSFVLALPSLRHDLVLAVPPFLLSAP